MNYINSTIELLQLRAEQYPNRTAYKFISDDVTKSTDITFGELDLASRAVGACLQELKGGNERVLLLFPSGIDFITAFIGCLYAGAVAIPAYPPRMNRGLSRIISIIQDAQPSLVLTTKSLYPQVQSLLSDTAVFKNLKILPVDYTDYKRSQEWKAPLINRDSLAFLQYTSGSTNVPKGVMVTHGNILSNEEMISRCFDQSESSVIVSWLPLYHDMGLIGGVLQPLYLGAKCILLSPASFLQKPRRWLEAISHYRGTTSGGPNFAYDLCARKISESEKIGLDLTSWRVAFNGAEPIRAETVDRFAKEFAECGFSRRSFYPCYGLAEATLFVTGSQLPIDAEYQSISTIALKQESVDYDPSDNAKKVVDCGQTWVDGGIIIVDPETSVPSNSNSVGEIWVTGSNVAVGYWNNLKETERCFQARLNNQQKDVSRKQYLRTGDLGFIKNGHLYVTGRLKDLIIVRGHNYYPQDIEFTAENSHSKLRPGCGAAFEIEVENEEHVVVVHEVERSVTHAGINVANDIIDAIRRSVAEEHELSLYEIVLIKIGTIPKTSSGKIQRHACRERYVKEELEVIFKSASVKLARSDAVINPAISVRDRLLQTPLLSIRNRLLETYLIEEVNKILCIAHSHIDLEQPLISYGLDSLGAAEICQVIEEQFNISVSLPSILNGASISGISDEIVKRLAQDQSTSRNVHLAGLKTKFPLSYGQRGLWFQQQLAIDSAAYSISVAFRILGELDLEVFKRCFQKIINKHTALRTGFHQTRDGEIFQQVSDQISVNFKYIEAQHWDVETFERQLCQDASIPLDLESQSLFRVTVFHRSVQEHVAIIIVHHLVADFHSLVIIFDELTNLYVQEIEQVQVEYELPNVHYSDYVDWERVIIDSREGEKLRDYWINALSSLPASMDFPTDKPRPAVQTYCAGSTILNLNQHTFDTLQRLSHSAETSLFSILLAVFKILLARYTGQSDIVVGSPVGTRVLPEIKNLVGYFVNPVVFRTNISSHQTFLEYLNQVKNITFGALEHQAYPFPLLVEQIHPERDLSRSPVFQVMFSFQKALRAKNKDLSYFALGETGAEIELGLLKLSSIAIDDKQIPFDLILTASELTDCLTVSLQYNRSLFEDDTAIRILSHFNQLLNIIIASPYYQLSQFDLLLTSEREQLLIDCNATEVAFNHECLIHELFEEQVDRISDSVAIAIQNMCLSFSELEMRANRIANYLRHRGVSAEIAVGIHLERSLELVIAILGILKAGGAYLILDPSHPSDRLKQIIFDSDVQLILSDRLSSTIFSEYTGNVLYLDQILEEVEQESSYRLSRSGLASSTAYILYTSGSSGSPKGVSVPHHAVVNFLSSMSRQPGLSSNDIFISVTTPSFDIFGLELYLPLMVGAKLVMPSKEITTDGILLWNSILSHSATAMQATPATWRLLLLATSHKQELSQRLHLNKLLCGGEALSRDLADELHEFSSSVWNLYGPTETTIWSSIYEYTDNKVDQFIGEIPIGYPIENTQLYVVDLSDNIVPVIVRGELLIGGAGVSRGYWKQPELTAEKFVPDGFSDKSGGRLYRTGDMVRRHVNGVLEFIGRIDGQIKVRGFRIEIAEIEAVLNSYPLIYQAVVIIRQSLETQQLIAYLVSSKKSNEPELDVGKLRSFLLDRLPDPFIPSLFVILDNFPLTPNGKIDRKSLALPELGKERQETKPHHNFVYQSALEKMIAGIWEQVLNIKNVGRQENFFDLGGHSLLLAQVQSRLSINGYDVSMLDLLRYPTIKVLSEYLDSKIRKLNVIEEEYTRDIESGALAIGSSNDIAIIGVAGRFPGASDVTEFWKRLCNGDDCITFFTNEELSIAGIDSEILGNPSYVKAKGVLQDAELFDASFFGMHPREAELTDPQHRVFLECAWQALEDAGYDPARYAGRIGVFSGAGFNSYLYQVASDLSDSSALRYQAFIGNDKDFLATRVSYKLNLTGPSLNIQTACSTSLVAVHIACRSIIDGECDMALAGGVAIRFPQEEGYVYEDGGILSPDGRCRAFDKDANGTVFGSGVGIIVLKPLKEALDNGDNIYAVIKGSAINNDGGAKIGYTAPGVNGQAEVIAKALSVAGVEPETISYLETHGTGTQLGDPVEITGLTEAYRTRTNNRQFCAVGSVKTNIGHLDTAAGIAGLIKVLCALKHRLLPPSINFVNPNPKIDFKNSPFYLNTRLTEWDTQANPRRAGVSSFGIGGTNAHVIMEEAPSISVSVPSFRSRHLLIISAKTNSALDKVTKNLADKLRTDLTINLADVSYTTHVGRQEFAHRRVAICKDNDDAIKILDSLDSQKVITGYIDNNRAPVVFLLPGQGAQHVNMGYELYKSEPAFAHQIDICFELLKSSVGLDMKKLLFLSSELNDEERQDIAYQLEQTAFAQPALFVIEYALAKLWMEWGVTPVAMIGHSVGEYVAACLAGVISLEDALSIVVERGKLMQSMPSGAMLSVELSIAKIEPFLKNGLTLAAVNTPISCVLSGTKEAIAVCEDSLAKQGIRHARLHTSHAFHSSMMDPIIDEFVKRMTLCSLKEPQIPYVSNLTGKWITAQEATDPQYWGRQLRETVRFNQGIETILGEFDSLMLEIGPGRVLSTLVRQHKKNVVTIPSLPHPLESRSEFESLIEALGRLWVSGININWDAFYRNERRHRVSLPPYPFERQFYRIKSDKKEGRNLQKKYTGEQICTPLWRRSMLPSAVENYKQSSSWLVMTGEGQFSVGLITYLRNHNIEIITVRCGNQFEAFPDNSYMINPHQDGDYDSLMHVLQQKGCLPQVIVHAWNVTDSNQTNIWLQSSSAEDLQCRTFDGLLFLVRAFEKYNPEAPIRMGIISDNMHKVCGESKIYPEKSLLLGPSKVIPQEYPNISCISIDLPQIDWESNHHDHYFQNLFYELISTHNDQIVAYRGEDRMVRTYEPWSSITNSESDIPRRLKDNGVYLITGGLGGIGLTLAEEIARTVKAKLILVGRSNIPEQSDREKWITDHGDENSWSRVFHKINKIEELGSQVITLSVDITDKESLAHNVAHVEDMVGKVDGVIHSAGIAGGGTIQLKTPDIAHRVLAPKVLGTLALHSVFKDYPLDFFVICSSVNSITGGYGQSDYCAANAFCDAFAQVNFGRNKTQVISINWDRWNDVGMAVQTRSSSDNQFYFTGSGVIEDDEKKYHPLLDNCLLKTEERIIFVSQFSPGSHWILSEHRIIDRPTVPGTAYLEMVRAAYSMMVSLESVEIQEVRFKTPLVIEENSRREVVTMLDKNSDGYHFRIISKISESEGGGNQWEEHVSGKIGPLTIQENRNGLIDIHNLMRNGKNNIARIDRKLKFISTGPRWENIKDCYFLGNEALAILEMNDGFSEELAIYTLHPSLLDTAAGFIHLSMESNYLPLAYERLSVHKPMPQRAYSYVKFRGQFENQPEVLTCDISIKDESGAEVAGIEGFSMRRITDDIELKPPVTNSEYVKIEDKTFNRDWSSGISPSRGAALFQQVLNAGGAPQVIISTREIREMSQMADSFNRTYLLKEFDKFTPKTITHARPPIDTVYKEPTNEIERVIISVWQRVLGIEQIGIHDNFFEIGGSSLSAVQLASELKKEFKKDIPVVSIFEAPTVAAFAGHLLQNQNQGIIFERNQDRAEKKKQAMKNWQQRGKRS